MVMCVEVELLGDLLYVDDAGTISGMYVLVVCKVTKQLA